VNGPKTTSNGGLGETRQHFRSARKLRWAVEFEPIHAARDAPAPDEAIERFRAFTLGVSLGGAFIAYEKPPPIETDLYLWLSPQNPVPGTNRVLRLRARVRWINPVSGTLPRGFGVAFHAITAADEVFLHRSFSRSEKVV